MSAGLSTGTFEGSATKTPRADALTGLRFFAAMAIVVWHSDYMFGVDAFAPVVLNSAVAVFFSLSGFVLALNAWKYTSWPEFWIARIARIWPAHVVAVLIWLALFYPYSVDVMLTPEGYRGLALNLALLQSWSPDKAIFWSYNAPSWSVSVELFLYAVFPGCLTLLRWRPIFGLAMMFLVAAAFLFGTEWLMPALSPLWIGYINPIVNLPLFGLGIAAGLLHVRLPPPESGYRTATWLQVGMLALTVTGNVVTGLPMPFVAPAAAQWVHTSGGCLWYVALIYVLSHYDGAVSRFLAHRTLRYLGEISYALYLVHQLLFRWHSSHTDELHFNIWLQYAGVLTASILTAVVIHHSVEKPVQQAVRREQERRRRRVVV